MTVLELMVVLAIIGGAAVLVRSGFRLITKADLVENSSELAAVMKRTSQLAVEHGEMHRIVFDLEKQIFAVEVCIGSTAIQRNEKLRNDAEEKKKAMDKGKDKMRDLPPDALASADPEAAAKKAMAIAASHVADKECSPVADPISGDSSGKGWIRALRSNKGIKFREIWVQHRDDSVTHTTKPSPQVAIYFFPNGTAEKAVVELTDGDPDRNQDGETFSVLVYGLTGRVELLDGMLPDVNSHMLRNVMGDKDAKREDQR